MTITNPTYYKNSKGEDLITYYANNFTREKFIGFMVGNIIKYVTRFEGKNGLEDLKKANAYVVRLHNELKRMGSEVTFNVDTTDSNEMSADAIKEASRKLNDNQERNTRPEENRKNLEDVVNSINEVNAQADEEMEEDYLKKFYKEESEKHELRDWLHDVNQSLRETSNGDFLFSLLKTTRKGKH